MKLLLWPGDLIARMTGLPEDSDNRMVLRMYANVVFWGVISTLVMVSIMT